MESDSVLSREEIEALLSAIRAPEETPPAPVQPLDFRRPRRLLSAELRRLREIHAPLLESVTRACKKWLNAPVQVRLLDPAESTFAELLVGRPGESLVARAGDILVDPSPPVAFALVERSLGGRRLTRPPDRPLRNLEAELLTPAIAEIFGLLRTAWGDPAPATLRWGLASELAREPWPEGSCALIAIEILAEGLLGDLLFAVPVARFEPVVARPPAADPAPVPGVEIEVAARFPLGALRLGDLRELAPGDLLVWSGDGAAELTLDVSKRPRFAGRPGMISGRAAIEVLRPASHDPAPSPLVRIPGGGISSGVPEVPIEIRAILAERMISLQDLGALRPGARIEFPRPADAPVELRMGRRVVARGPVVRSGDRLAVKVETNRESGGSHL